MRKELGCQEPSFKCPFSNGKKKEERNCENEPIQCRGYDNGVINSFSGEILLFDAEVCIIVRAPVNQSYQVVWYGQG